MKSGFAVIVGRSNVGKSTLLNALVGTKLAAVSAKAQTTRHIIHGVFNDARGQVVFVDTPGILKRAKSLLTSKLTQKIKDALDGIDCVIYLVDPTREIGDEEKWMLALLKNVQIPIILVINKMDLHKSRRPYQEWYEDLSGQFKTVVRVSALKLQHLKTLVDEVFKYMPEGEPLYGDQQKTNVESTFWIAEIIREKIFNTMGEEIPYATHVVVDSVEEKPDITVIKARILTTEERHKPMLIGRHGVRIKEIGQTARAELATALNRKIFLELEVEVDPHWIARFE